MSETSDLLTPLQLPNTLHRYLRGVRVMVALMTEAHRRALREEDAGGDLEGAADMLDGAFWCVGAGEDDEQRLFAWAEAHRCRGPMTIEELKS